MQPQSGAETHPPGQSAYSRHGFWFTHRGYALQCTLRRLFTRKLTTLATLFVMALSMTLPVLFYLMMADVQRISTATTATPGLLAYLDPALSDIEGARVAESLRARADVGEVIYISKAEALAELGAGAEGQSVLQTVELLGSNPLPGALTIQPFALGSGSSGGHSTGSEEHNRLAQTLQAIDSIERVEVDIEWVERLAAIREFLSISGWICIIVLLVAALMVLSNTVRLELLRYARESSVIHLLGGSRTFRLRPFIYLGALLGFAASLLACLLAATAMLLLNVPVESLAQSYGVEFSLPLPGFAEIARIVIASTLLGMLTAIFSVRRSVSTISQPV